MHAGPARQSVAACRGDAVDAAPTAHRGEALLRGGAPTPAPRQPLTHGTNKLISGKDPEWPHRQCVGLAFRRLAVRGSLSAASQLDLPVNWIYRL